VIALRAVSKTSCDVALYGGDGTLDIGRPVEIPDIEAVGLKAGVLIAF
jgi:hypothetical protein